MPPNLHIDVTVHADGHSARAVISRAHTNFIFISHDYEILLEEKPQKEESASTDDIKLNLAMVYDFAMNSPLDEISFILKAKELNLAAAQLAFDGNTGIRSDPQSVQPGQSISATPRWNTWWPTPRRLAMRAWAAHPWL